MMRCEVRQYPHRKRAATATRWRRVAEMARDSCERGKLLGVSDVIAPLLQEHHRLGSDQECSRYRASRASSSSRSSTVRGSPRCCLSCRASSR